MRSPVRFPASGPGHFAYAGLGPSGSVATLPTVTLSQFVARGSCDRTSSAVVPPDLLKPAEGRRVQH